MEFLTLLMKVILISSLFILSEGKTWLRADGNTDNTYNLLNSVLGGTAYEVPDCAHPAYGPHITQRFDDKLNRSVFTFHVHVTPDNDGYSLFDRQRVEIKTYDPSPSELKGFQGETVTLSWNFRLNSQFQPSSKFTHIHQIKAKGGSDKSPLITLTPRRRGSSNVLEVIYTEPNGNFKVLKSDDLSKFAGKWIHVVEELTYSQNGKYSLVFSRTDNGEHVMTVTNSNTNLWRDGYEYVRPKWGIYRGLDEASALRDEHVSFDSFCFGKGNDKCS